uniref:Uncharacterized protein n=1 Tax=Bionectria ochroleuca TaxID=29856 RepID=A0A0B7KQH8_BIOOC
MVLTRTLLFLFVRPAKSCSSVSPGASFKALAALSVGSLPALRMNFSAASLAALTAFRSYFCVWRSHCRLLCFIPPLSPLFSSLYGLWLQSIWISFIGIHLGVINTRCKVITNFIFLVILPVTFALRTVFFTGFITFIFTIRSKGYVVNSWSGAREKVFFANVGTVLKLDLLALSRALPTRS